MLDFGLILLALDGSAKGLEVAKAVSEGSSIHD